MGKGGGLASQSTAAAAAADTSARERERRFTATRRDSDAVNGEGRKASPNAKPATGGEMPMLPVELEGETEFERNRSLIWKIFEEPEKSFVSTVVNMYILSLIMISAVVTVVETIPGLHKQDEHVWDGLETFFVMNFSLEFLCRVCTTDHYGRFVTTFMNWIDIVSITPFYVDLIVGGSGSNLSVLRVLRLGRSLRLIKVSRYSKGIRLVANAMEQSLDALQLFFFLLTIVLVVCSSAIYYTERGEYNESLGYFERKDPLTGTVGRSPFQSIPQSFWWCLVTLTTVGYGDTYPITYPGQIVGCITMLLGLVMLALPLSIIGTNFIEERAIMIREKERQDQLEAEEKARAEGKVVASVDSQSLKSQLENTIDVINEVMKYQELIVESMGDAIKLIAATKAAAAKGRETVEVVTVPAMGDGPVESGSGSGSGSGIEPDSSREGSGLGAGVGEDSVPTEGGAALELQGAPETPSKPDPSTEKREEQEAPAAAGGTGGGETMDEELVPVDAVVVHLLEVLCKNVIKSCEFTQAAIL